MLQEIVILQESVVQPIKEISFLPKSIKLKDIHKKIIEQDEIKIEEPLPLFSKLNSSTQTVIVFVNMIFVLDKLFKHLPCVIPGIDYKIIVKKRGRKRKDDIKEPNKFIKVGTILTLKYKGKIRGVELKPKKKSNQNNNFTKHSLEIRIALKYDKSVVMKVSANGKIQITGCKNNEQCYEVLKLTYNIILKTQKEINDTLVDFKTDSELNKTLPYGCFSAIILVVMKNYNYKSGFLINREKLNTFVNNTKEFISIFDSSMTNGVNIKFKNEHPFDEHLPVYLLDVVNQTNDKENNLNKIQLEDSITSIKFDTFLNLLDENERNKLLKKDKYISFLCFHTGAIILSSSNGGQLTEKVYNTFRNLLLTYKEYFEDLTEGIPIKNYRPKNSYFIEGRPLIL